MSIVNLKIQSLSVYKLLESDFPEQKKMFFTFCVKKFLISALITVSGYPEQNFDSD